MVGMPADGAEVAQDVIVKRWLAIRRVVQAEKLDRGALRDLKQVLLIALGRPLKIVMDVACEMPSII
jgi:hypothetical protein